MAEDAARVRLLQNIHDLQEDYRKSEKALDEFGPLAPELYQLWRELGTYQPGDDPCKAVYLVAKCHTRLDLFSALYAAVTNYNEAQRKLEEHDRRRNIENG